MRLKKTTIREPDKISGISKIVISKISVELETTSVHNFAQLEAAMLGLLVKRKFAHILSP